LLYVDFAVDLHVKFNNQKLTVALTLTKERYYNANRAPLTLDRHSGKLLVTHVKYFGI